MEKYGVNQLREMFLSYMESKGHLRLKSFSLVPHNDNSLLLINSGMAPLKPYFTGQEIPPCRRVTTCQKCIRTGDIEYVGKTARHATFFEMLGNFSFGDYFKKDAIRFTWEFLTDVIGLEPDRLYPSVYLDDDEAYELWNKDIGIPEDRIFRFGKADNFWEHGAGPCGPCSEVYYDRGEKYGCGKPTCTVGCDCDRYMEVWNDVFSQFNNDGHGNYTDLAQKNIDTGMGLERLAVVVQDVDSIYTIDTSRALLDRACAISGKAYKADEDDDVSLRILVDHARACTFMISDGIMPSNEGRGYVLRRLLRRAAHHGKNLGIEGGFMPEMAKTVIETYKAGYPELEEKEPMILKVLSEEEEKFDHAIEQGSIILTQMEAEMEERHDTVLPGEDAFKLYDTYGFPLDLTRDILAEKGFTIDQQGFDDCMQTQRETARRARKATNYMGADETVYQSIPATVSTTFVGYDRLSDDSKISILTTETELVQALTDGQTGTIITDETPFYGTMGGQVGDTGVITGPNGTFVVEDTIHIQGNKMGHIGRVTSGMFVVGEKVHLEVDAKRRMDIARNHSATHLLQKSLRTVLGDHVEQAGSLVTPDRLRFDFTHFSAMTPEEIKQTEDLVNQAISDSLAVVTEEMSLEDAKKTGAMALFGEKYGEVVRVVEMGNFSLELCGGTHVANTGDIHAFKIISESGIAAGVRRIEALTGDGILAYLNKLEDEFGSAARQAKTTPGELEAKIVSMQEEMRSLRSENEKLKSRLANDSLGDVMDKVREIDGVKVLAAKVPDNDMNGLRNLGDQLRGRLGEGVIVLASSDGDKVSLIAMATDEAQKAGAHAGKLISSIAASVGGGGGGRPGMAQAGGKNPAGIDEALDKVYDVVREQLGSR